jgi:hypothetical protein
MERAVSCGKPPNPTVDPGYLVFKVGGPTYEEIGGDI